MSQDYAVIANFNLNDIVYAVCLALVEFGFFNAAGGVGDVRMLYANPGTVIADSDENPARLSDHSNRPEIKTAMLGKTGTQLRFSASLGVKMLYVATPLSSIADGQIEKFHVLRMSMPTSAINHTLQKPAVEGCCLWRHCGPSCHACGHNRFTENKQAPGRNDGKS